MKKLLTLGMVFLLVAMGSVFAFADETDSNMTSDVYLETRLAQIEAAVEDGTITEAQADLLIAHITERASEGVFGYKGSNEECVLGDEALGLFRNENAGMKSGSGYGVKSSDGTGFKRGGNMNGGQGSQDGTCIVE